MPSSRWCKDSEQEAELGPTLERKQFYSCFTSSSARIKSAGMGKEMAFIIKFQVFCFSLDHFLQCTVHLHFSMFFSNMECSLSQCAFSGDFESLP